MPENSVENGAFARYEQMLHFLHCFQIVSATEALKGACVEKRVKLKKQKEISSSEKVLTNYIIYREYYQSVHFWIVVSLPVACVSSKTKCQVQCGSYTCNKK